VASQKARARSGQSRNRTAARGSAARATVPAQPGAGPQRNSGGQGRETSGRGQDAAGPGRPQGRGRAPGARPGSGEVAAPAVPAGRPAPGRWFQIATLVLSLAGLGASIYLTVQHYTAATSFLGCPATSTFNCQKVTTSPESIIFGIPVAVLGLAFYVFMVAVNTPWAWRSRLPAIYWARLGGIVLGIVFVLYLIYTELFTIGAICVDCTSVHIITFLLFCLLIFNASLGSSTAMSSGTTAKRAR
jgi:uncharacterized membrane protein